MARQMKMEGCSDFIETPLCAFLRGGSAYCRPLRLDHVQMLWLNGYLKNSRGDNRECRAESICGSPKPCGINANADTAIMMMVGTVDSLWRYPVKSMAGEALHEAFFGCGGIYGDRMFGFVKSLTPTAAAFLTARDWPGMVRYRPRFRNPALVANPPNQSKAGQTEAGLMPLYPGPSALIVDVETPTGEMLTADSPMLLAQLTQHLSRGQLSVARSDRGMQDSYPVSLISLSTIKQLGDELHAVLDKRRFRANIYARSTGAPFAEDSFIGKRLQLGSRVVVAAMIHDKRCKIITIDPDTAKETPRIMRNVARLHEGNAGIYCDVIIEGIVRVGDPIALLN